MLSAPSTHARMNLGLILLMSLAIILAAGAPARADGLKIVANFGSSITSDPNSAAIEGTINLAIGFYQATFTDPITVNITFNEGGGLGASSTFFANLPYAVYLAALTADATSANDATALAHLPPGPNNPVNGSALINVKTANLRAVGINFNPPPGQPDGTITLNTHLTNVGSPGTTGQYSLFAVTEHEINEVLGLGSSLPSILNGTIFPEDLFRYDGSGARSFTTNPAVAFFSIDGTTELAQFHNLNDGGDFGDWQSNPFPPGASPKVQDVSGTPGSNPFLTLGSPEVTALDVIGYTPAAPPVTPEPTTLVLYGTGLAAIAASRRRKGVRSGTTL